MRRIGLAGAAGVLAILGLFSGSSLAASLSTTEEVAICKTLVAGKDLYNKGDADALIDLMPPKAVEFFGGREAYGKAVKKALDQQREVLKTQFEQLDCNPPRDVVTAGNTVIAVIPTVSIMSFSGKRMRITGFMIASRTNGENIWKVMDGTPFVKAPFLMSLIFPGFPEDFKFPESKTEPAE